VRSTFRLNSSYVEKISPCSSSPFARINKYGATAHNVAPQLANSLRLLRPPSAVWLIYVIATRPPCGYVPPIFTSRNYHIKYMCLRGSDEKNVLIHNNNHNKIIHHRHLFAKPTVSAKLFYNDRITQFKEENYSVGVLFAF